MTKATNSIVCSLAVAALTIGTGAMARPGGGGGMGGQMGGGMGIGREMSINRGADLPYRTDNHATIRSNIDAPHQPTVRPNASTTVLDRNARVDTALSGSLTRHGIALPTGGLKTACAGYITLGNCVAALHVAHNLGLQGGFTALKGLTTGANAISLGDAVKQLRPSADATAAVRAANRQANADIEASGG